MGFFEGHTFDRDLRAHQTRQVIGWWERRRFYFNKVVGLTGVATTVLMITCGLVGQHLIGIPIGIPNPPIILPLAMIAYGIAANICYTGGWIVELLLSKMEDGKNMTEFGLNAFRNGLKLSIALTLFPAALCWGTLLYQLAAKPATHS